MLIKNKNQLVIVCIKCVQQMTIHASIYDEFYRDIFVAASCKCGKILGLVSEIKLACNEAISSEMIEPITPNQVGNGARGSSAL